MNTQVELDPRPEYARARILSHQGKFFAEITDNQVRSLFLSKTSCIPINYCVLICNIYRIYFFKPIR